MKQADRKAQNRQKILNAATQLMTTQGFKNTNIRQISELAGISYVTMYKYFPSKNEIISAVMQGLIDQRFEQISRAITNSEQDFLATLNKLRTINDWFDQKTPEFIHNEFNAMLANPNITIDKEYINQRIQHIIAQVVQIGRRDGFIKSKASDQVIVEVLSFFFQQNSQVTTHLYQNKQRRYEIGILLLFGLNGNRNEKKAD